MPSRLRSLVRKKLPDYVGPCAFRKLPGGYLLTNDWGRHHWLSPGEFERYFSGRLAKGSASWRELRDKGFLRDRLDFPALAGSYARKNAFLWSGPRLHIAVLTLRCNHRCAYCQASAAGPKGAGRDMTEDTARRVTEYVFESPAQELTIEFQGGEPLMNWRALETIVRYGGELAAASGRKLRLALVSNLSLLDDRRLEFLMEHKVSVCTSLDGPAALHDRNRPYPGGSGHAVVERWLRTMARRYPDRAAERHPRPNALLTVTRRSLPLAEEIVDEYARLGLPGIFVRPLTPIGTARRSRAIIGYSTAEFLEFYGRCLDRVLELNRAGTPLRERGAAMLLTKILKGWDPGYTDLRSPCGAGLGQLAYNYDGDIYTCDEGRMLSEEGDRLFRLGSVFDTPYERALRHPTVKACAVASHLEDQPVCSGCAYKPFCGVCPVYNYVTQDTIWGRMPTSERCALYKGVFDLIFERLRDPGTRRIFEDWARGPASGGADGADENHGEPHAG
ncbi:MAG: His-Xaa-Ser system radical SAM maturase HxsB [Elusimicrobiota bacterium]